MSKFQRGDYLGFVQNYSILLDGGMADFFKGESLLSELTLAETLGSQLGVSLSDAIACFRASQEKIAKLIPHIIEADELLRTVIDYQDFYFEQQRLLTNLNIELQKLSNEGTSLERAYSQGKLQESLYHDGANAVTRGAGIAATRLICQILAEHSDKVEETNE